MPDAPHTPTPWPKPEYYNDVGPSDESFREFWFIEGIAQFKNEKDALLAWSTVNSYDALTWQRAALLSACEAALKYSDDNDLIVDQKWSMVHHLLLTAIAWAKETT